ncbi:MAG: hypothetical protein M3Y84_06675 [Acidobacteriota bacterium]|nr:hypothetical protein [Acidobacteriota bacterium]
MPARLALVIAVLLAVPPVASSANSARLINYSTPSVSFQQQDGWVAIKTDDGILFVWNIRELHFTLAIKGKDIKPLNDPDHIFFTVDGMALQIQVVSIREFAPDAKEKKFDDRTILAAHRDWEFKFIEGLLNSKLKLQTFNARVTNGGDASLWQFDMPKGIDAEAKTQLYLTVVREDYVVMLNSAATTTISEEAARKVLLDTIVTLKISPALIDVKKLSESISAGSKP